MCERDGTNIIPCSVMEELAAYHKGKKYGLSLATLYNIDTNKRTGQLFTLTSRSRKLGAYFNFCPYTGNHINFHTAVAEENKGESHE